MATPKGTRSYSLPLNATDAIHIYSNTKGIWMQMRRLVPTEESIDEPSFKVAMEIPPEIARLLSAELAKVASDPGPRTKRKAGSKKAPAVLELGLCSECKETPLIGHLGRGWCPLCGKFDRFKRDAVLPIDKGGSEAKKKPKVHDFISDGE